MSVFDERGDGGAGTLSPRQARIVAELARLLGQGTADFFHDACTMVVETPAHRTASHLISHALREADSGLRKVLEPRKPETKARGKSNDGHRRSIASVCEVLGLPLDHPAVEFWLDQAGESSTNLAGRAHRRGLGVVRRASNWRGGPTRRKIIRMADQLGEAARLLRVSWTGCYDT